MRVKSAVESLHLKNGILCGEKIGAANCLSGGRLFYWEQSRNDDAVTADSRRIKSWDVCRNSNARLDKIVAISRYLWYLSELERLTDLTNRCEREISSYVD